MRKHTKQKINIILRLIWLIILLELFYTGFQFGYFRLFPLGIFVHIQELLTRFVLAVVHIPDFLAT